MADCISMKILHVSTAHPRDDIRIYHKMVKHLKLEGFNVSLLVADGLKDECVDNIDIHDVGKASNRFGRFFFTSLRMMHRIIKEKPKFIHFHDPDFIIVAFILNIMNYQVIYDVHEDVPRQILGKKWIPKYIRRFVANVFEILEVRLSSRFYAIVCTTETISKRFIRSNSRVITIKNYPIVSEFIGTNFVRKRNAICYVGAISESRGIIELMLALERLPGYTLTIAGLFESKELEERVRAMPSWRNVTYLGKIGRSEIVKLLAESSIGAVTLHPTPNYVDSLPIKMFEYMASGLPILASDFPVWLNLINRNEVGLCANPLDVSDLINKVELLSRDIDSYIDKGNEIVQSKYSWENEFIKLRSLYSMRGIKN